MKKTICLCIILTCFCLVTNICAADGYVAKIGNEGFNSLSEAILKAGATNTTITLNQDVDLKEKLSFPKGSNIVLDLNGKNLSVPTVENNYGIVVLGNLTIIGKGVVSLGEYGIGVGTTGNLVIEAGTYKCLNGTYLIGSWGKATLKGGLFDGNYCIANGFDNGTVDILDGTFYSKESTIVLGNVKIFSGAFNQDIHEHLAPGVEMKKYNGLYFTGKKYYITIEDAKNGTVTTLSEAVEEQPVKVETKAGEGYELDNIKVITETGKIIGVRNGEFVMPGENVTVYGLFETVSFDDTPKTGKSNVAGCIFLLVSIVALATCINGLKTTRIQ